MEGVSLHPEEERRKRQEIPDNALLSEMYPIGEELQHPAPTKFVPEVGWELHPSMLADTPEGRYLLTRELAFMKQAVPNDVEVNIRINPKSGKAEIFARGENLDLEEYRAKIGKILNGRLDSTPRMPPMAEDYKNASCSFSPKDQEALIKNTKSALQTIGTMERGYESYAAISDHVARQTGFDPSKEGRQAAAIKDIQDTLQSAGVQEAGKGYAMQPMGAAPKKTQGSPHLP